jgi:hypothetical protein
MSLEYYLFCRHRYEQIISNLEDILEAYELIINCTMDEENLEINHYEIFEPEDNNTFFTNKLNHMKKLKKLCDNKINNLCNHDFENDLIDISPDKSDYITYCKICGFTK